MLQIGSKRLFSREPEHTNHLRGILYSNLRLYGDRRIETAAGTLLGTHTLRGRSSLIYEFTEHIEAPATGRGALVSRGVEPYLEEFSCVVAFALNATCTPNADTLQRLTTKSDGGRDHPSELVLRAFDPEIAVQDEDERRLIAFVDDLVRLERRSYRAAVRAISGYVTGLHRIGDNLELAYALIVATVESLAQQFDGHKATWADYDDAKRKRVDQALAGAGPEASERVRSAILENEHVTLGRRFRDFALAHIEPSFFRGDAQGRSGPAARPDLAAALTRAYRLRSRYLHSLEELPRLLTFGPILQDIMVIDREPTLTFQGLARVARHVIMTFVARQPKCDAEPYNYVLEQAGVVQAPMSEEYWVGHPESLTATAGRRRLEGFLNQLAATYLDRRTPLTDLRPVLAKVEEMMLGLRDPERRPFVALSLLFSRVVSHDEQPEGAKAMWDAYGALLNEPSPESLIAHLITGHAPEWPIHDHQNAVDDYFRQRLRPKGLRVPVLFEVGILLALAERYRRTGEPHKATASVVAALECWPGHPKLLELEAVGVDAPLSWEALLLPSAADSPPT